MKILDALHSKNFHTYEESFQKAKEENQKLLDDVSEMESQAKKLIDE